MLVAVILVSAISSLCNKSDKVGGRKLTFALQFNAGGPLVLRTGTEPTTPVVQVGIVSFGGYDDPSFICANPEYPVVYTRVSAVADWIKKTVCAKTGELCQNSSKAGKR